MVANYTDEERKDFLAAALSGVTTTIYPENRNRVPEKNIDPAKGLTTRIEQIIADSRRNGSKAGDSNNHIQSTRDGVFCRD